jgi:hypothetical protein
VVSFSCGGGALVANDDHSGVLQHGYAATLTGEAESAAALLRGSSEAACFGHRRRTRCMVMRTSILQLQSFLPLRYLALSHDHEHNN